MYKLALILKVNGLKINTQIGMKNHIPFFIFFIFVSCTGDKSSKNNTQQEDIFSSSTQLIEEDSLIQTSGNIPYLYITEYSDLKDNKGGDDFTPTELIKKSLISMGGQDDESDDIERIALQGHLELGVKWLCIQFPDTISKNKLNVQENITAKHSYDFTEEPVTTLRGVKANNNTFISYNIAFRGYTVKDFSYKEQEKIIDLKQWENINNLVKNAIINKKVFSYRYPEDTLKMVDLTKVGMNNREILIANYISGNKESIYNSTAFLIENDKVFCLNPYNMGLGLDIHFFTIKGQQYLYTAFHKTAYMEVILYKLENNSPNNYNSIFCMVKTD